MEGVGSNGARDASEVVDDRVRHVVAQRIEHGVNVGACLVQEQEWHDSGNVVIGTVVLLLLLLGIVIGHPGRNSHERGARGLNHLAEVLRTEVRNALAARHQLARKLQGRVNVAKRT